MGSVRINNQPNTFQAVVALDVSIEKDIHILWELESVPSITCISSEDEEAENMFLTSVERTVENCGVFTLSFSVH